MAFSATKPKVIRTDIQALRAIAVSLVVLFHLWPNRLPGGFIGVDVFFVISGFLITQHILHEVSAGTFSITAFWSRRIKRLLPASFLVLTVTGVAIAVWVPISQWSQWFGEVIASVFYFENWNLAGASVDYLALANQASPVQHFWSLSTEEQFYFVWPMLVALAVFWSARRGAKRSIFVALLLVTLLSLAYGIYFTSLEPAIAYFSTPVRAWEFGAGSLLAFAPAIGSARIKTFLVWAGLLAMGAGAYLIDTRTPFPGIAALLPVLGTAAVLLARIDAGPLSKLFSIRPIQWLGDKSYAIYLWHWPILIFAPFWFSGTLSSIQKISLLALTLVLAWFTQQRIEAPIAKLQIAKWKIFALAATTSVAIASLAGLAVQIANQQITDQLNFGKSGSVAAEPCFGAAARTPGAEACTNDRLTGLYPSLATAAADLDYSPEYCNSLHREDVAAEFCALGDSDSAIKIAAVGDSHLAQYAGGLHALGLKNNWQIDLYVKGGCPFTNAVRVHDAVLTKACPAWVANVFNGLSDRGYDLVVTSQRAGVDWNGGQAAAIKGTANLWSRLVQGGFSVVAIKDSPVPAEAVLACLQAGNDCLIPRAQAFRFDAQLAAAKLVPEVELINFDEIFCDSLNCLPIIGNVVVYRDDNHLTDTFARTLAQFIEPTLKKYLGNYLFSN